MISSIHNNMCVPTSWSGTGAVSSQATCHTHAPCQLSPECLEVQGSEDVYLIINELRDDSGSLDHHTVKSLN